MKIKFFLSILIISMVIVGCEQADSSKENSLNGTKDQDIKDLVSEYSTGTVSADSASITPEQLIIKNNKKEFVYDVSNEDFFVSIAPYINQTHPCTNHSLTGCQGELVNETFQVYIKDNDGNVLVNKQMKSQKNGFFDLWLPRDKTYQVKIEQNGKVAKSEISTYNTDGTCITTMQLI
ncbi:CueP family metal-binding protein [Paraliobacillus ryukyuensis]|uniref:CueP family metal-binding protein n=1 Tax=Paraliobacillus ryukyuensis TaxID=200904 RepID=UPI0009A5D055|nr:CueP family metal-binding protein [Paraliobacillus ryukyuensis]